MTIDRRPIEQDDFDFEFLSAIAHRESWRKEVHRPIYHMHKWWAKRLGSVFRGVLLGCAPTREKQDLRSQFYASHAFNDLVVFDPFLGSGTTIGEAHKLGFTALGRDINPVAAESVRVALGPLDEDVIVRDFNRLAETVAPKITELYRSRDRQGRRCDVLYFFWVMQAPCGACSESVDLFSSYVLAQNAYPARKPETQVVCPGCGDVFQSTYGSTEARCPSCRATFDPSVGPVRGQKARCPRCGGKFPVIEAISASGERPQFRLYAKLVLTGEGEKQYLPATDEDRELLRRCTRQLQAGLRNGRIVLPTLALEDGNNTRQALRYNFKSWRDFFNDRQLLALGLLHAAIRGIEDASSRAALMTLFSGVLEFNNLFASYKGEGTGAVRHMFSHHVLKPERTPIEAHVWGTSKSSGSFSGLFRSRLLRALAYRRAPTEVNGTGNEKGLVCSPPFSGKLSEWPVEGNLEPRGLYVSCGDSSATGLPAGCVDLVVTDPPFFDNVHYSELADFFYAWQQIGGAEGAQRTTRHQSEVQDSDADRFARKLEAVFAECCRLLKDDGLLVFSYHHSRSDGWKAVAEAVLGAGFQVVNAHPVKAEMSVATPKTQAKEPIQFDIIVVCRKLDPRREVPALDTALRAAERKIDRLKAAGFKLSRNDEKIIRFGQALTTLGSAGQIPALAGLEDGGRPIGSPGSPGARPRRKREARDTAVGVD